MTFQLYFHCVFGMGIFIYVVFFGEGLPNYWEFLFGKLVMVKKLEWGRILGWDEMSAI